MWHDKHGRPELTMSTEIMRGAIDWSPEDDGADVIARGEDPGHDQADDTAGKDQAGGDHGAVPRR